MKFLFVGICFLMFLSYFQKLWMKTCWVENNSTACSYSSQYHKIEPRGLSSNPKQEFHQVPSSSSSRSARVGALGSEYIEDWMSWVSFEIPLITMLPSGMMCSMRTKRMTSGGLDNGDHKWFCLANPINPLRLAPCLRSLREGHRRGTFTIYAPNTSFLCKQTEELGSKDDEQF